VVRVIVLHATTLPTLEKVSNPEKSCPAKFARLPPPFFADFTGASMKAKIIITPKKAVLDPQGKTVQTALAQMGHTGIKAVHVGKYLEIELEGSDVAAARASLNDAALKFLSNPVIEDYQLEIQ
jgi:phosphoribosylformylglycinamidine synthase